jgi:hypothetical protein
MPGAWKPGEPPPPLNVQRPREKEAVHDFFRYHLDRIVSPQTKFEIPKDLDPDKLKILKFRALAEANSGDVTKLRQLVSRLLGPEFADYIQPIKLKQGVKAHPPLADLSWVIVDLIKLIHRMHYPKRSYHHVGEWKYEEEVAARYLGVPELGKNPLHRRKKKPRARYAI